MPIKSRKQVAKLRRPPAIGIGMLLREADMAFNRYLRQELGVHAVTFGQFQHLRNLWVENGLTQAELSRRVGIEMASSTAILDSLEAERLITRVRNATDRRKVNVFLTPAGAALEKPLMACAAKANREARRGLTDAEVATVFAHVGRIIANFKALRAAEGEMSLPGFGEGGRAQRGRVGLVRPRAPPGARRSRATLPEVGEG
jgi:MarR family transcriptional regulator, organic hydroperoxide resistance regulator